MAGQKKVVGKEEMLEGKGKIKLKVRRGFDKKKMVIEGLSFEELNVSCSTCMSSPKPTSEKK